AGPVGLTAAPGAGAAGSRNQRLLPNRAWGSLEKGWTLNPPWTPQGSPMRATSTRSWGQSAPAPGKSGEALMRREGCGSGSGDGLGAGIAHQALDGRGDLGTVLHPM